MHGFLHDAFDRLGQDFRLEIATWSDHARIDDTGLDEPVSQRRNRVRIRAR